MRFRFLQLFLLQPDNSVVARLPRTLLLIQSTKYINIYKSYRISTTNSSFSLIWRRTTSFARRHTFWNVNLTWILDCKLEYLEFKLFSERGGARGGDKHFAKCVVMERRNTEVIFLFNYQLYIKLYLKFEPESRSRYKGNW